MDERIEQLRRAWWTLSHDVTAEIVSLALRKIARAEYSQPGEKEFWRMTLVERRRA